MSAKVDVGFDRYLKYEELGAVLRGLVAAYPDLAEMSTTGRSFEGRDVWVLTVTNRATGPSAEKPAVYVDGNMHAGEVTGSMVCLYLINYLLSRYGLDEEVTWLLDHRAFYICPRVNPDGAEKYLTTPFMLRSSVRQYPGPEVAELPGLVAEDLDGDGLIRQMRVRDDHRGEWKVSARDRRLLVHRLPDDRQGPFYRLYPEGMIKDFHGEPFGVRETLWGLDLNRNFPSNWSQKLRGGGPYPTSEPEVRNIVDFILAHPNIGALQAFHTSGGIIFRSPYAYPDEQMDSYDFATMKALARRGTDLTGYPDVSSYSGPYAATIVDWAYEHRGIFGFTTELWDLMGRAGVKDMDYYGKPNPLPAEVEAANLKTLQWNDRELAGRGFKDWTPFAHPQLGPVEIGGWDPKFVRQNPPPKLLEQECHKNALFPLKQAAALPELALEHVAVRRGSPGAGAGGSGPDESIFTVAALVANHSYLATNISQKALDTKVAAPVKVSIKLGAALSLLAGEAVQDIGQLQGFRDGQGGGAWGTAPARSAARCGWVVRLHERAAAPAERTITIEARQDKGGVARSSAVIG